jgi:hypothetical protein
MGSGSSVHVEKSTDKELEIIKRNMPTVDKFDKIDIFAKEMYLSSPKVEALQQLLSEEAGREAFMKFLRTQYATENLDFFIVSLHHIAFKKNPIVFKSLRNIIS